MTARAASAREMAALIGEQLGERSIGALAAAIEANDVVAIVLGR